MKRLSGSDSAARPASCAPPSRSCCCAAILPPRSAAQRRPRRRSPTGRGQGGRPARKGRGDGGARDRWGRGLRNARRAGGGASARGTPLGPSDGREGGQGRRRSEKRGNQIRRLAKLERALHFGLFPKFKSLLLLSIYLYTIT